MAEHEAAIRERVAARQIFEGDRGTVIENRLQAALGVGERGHRTLEGLGSLDHPLLELGVEAAHFVVRLAAFGPLGSLGERPPHSRRQPAHPILQHVVGRALLHAIDRQLLADAARQKNERHVGTQTRRDDLGGNAVERRQVVVGEDRVVG